MNWAKVVSGAAILAVAAVAGLISYTHIENLSLALHQPVMVARLMPFGVDGLITVGSVVLLQGGRLGWLGIGPGVAISLFANVESGIRYGWLAAVWAGIPAVSFALASFILENWLKGQAKAPVTAPLEASEDAPVTAPIEAPSDAPEGEPGSVPEGAPGANDTANPETPPRAKQVRRPNDLERRARRVLARRPDITGADLGRALEVSPRTGQKLLTRLKAAA
jgi:hypothetical protein